MVLMPISYELECIYWEGLRGTSFRSWYWKRELPCAVLSKVGFFGECELPPVLLEW